MRTFFIYDHFELYAVSETFWQKGKHRHQFFELLYIKKGAGIHILNENKIISQPDDIYLMTPDDEHSFQSLDPTEFYCFRFLPEFFSNESETNQKMIENLMSSMNSYNLSKGNLELSLSDKQILIRLIHLIIEEQQQTFENRMLIKQSMLLILQLISRNVLLGTNTTHLLANTLSIDNVLNYLRRHITQPQLIRKKAVADHFNVSATYIGEYFTQLSGTSMRAYISKLRMNIIDTKIVKSKLSNKQIAHDLGFLDSSHFYKFIKAQTGMAPTKYRVHLLTLNKKEKTNLF